MNILNGLEPPADLVKNNNTSTIETIVIIIAILAISFCIIYIFMMFYFAFYKKTGMKLFIRRKKQIIQKNITTALYVEKKPKNTAVIRVKTSFAEYTLLCCEIIRSHYANTAVPGIRLMPGVNANGLTKNNFTE